MMFSAAEYKKRLKKKKKSLPSDAWTCSECGGLVFVLGFFLCGFGGFFYCFFRNDPAFFFSMTLFLKVIAGTNWRHVKVCSGV